MKSAREKLRAWNINWRRQSINYLDEIWELREIMEPWENEKRIIAYRKRAQARAL